MGQTEFVIGSTSASNDSEPKIATKFLVVDPSFTNYLDTTIIRGFVINGLYVMESYSNWQMSQEEIIEYICEWYTINNALGCPTEIYFDDSGIGMMLKKMIEEQLKITLLKNTFYMAKHNQAFENMNRKD